MGALPEFSLRTRVAAEDALHDKIELDVKHRVFTSCEGEEDIQHLREHLAVPPLHQRTGDTVATYGRLFNRAGTAVRSPMEIRSSRAGHRAMFQIPLFSGCYRFTKVPESDC